MPGWLDPRWLVFGLALMGLGTVIAVGLAVVMGANSDREPPTRRGPGSKNGSQSDGPKGGT